jgi:hypothetical protein
MLEVCPQMRFEGDRLLLIIARQDVPFVVLDAGGKLERRFELPKTALPFIAAGGYFGVGNHRRIRYLKPIEDETQRDVFGSRQDFEHSRPRFPVREKASMPRRHDLSWGQHPARARIAGGGAVRSIRLREQQDGEKHER